MLKIRISEADSSRLNCPRDMAFDLDTVTGRDLLELEEQVGWNIDRFQIAVQGTPAVDAIGGPIYEMDPKNPDTPKLDGGGQPIRAMVIGTKTVMVLVWMCVRRANPDVAWKTFDVQITELEITQDEEGEPGKSPARRSPTSTTTTKRRSRRSTA